MNIRLKEIRTSKGMNQHDFAKSLGIGQSTLAMMEVGKRDITERHIKTICAIYGVNEHWFRTGDGDPFQQGEKSFLDQLAEEYGMSERERATIASFLKLNDKDRAAVMGYVDALVDKLGTDPLVNDTVAPQAAIRAAEPPATEASLAEEVAELKRQNQKMAKRLEAMEKEDTELEAQETAVRSSSPSQFH